MITISKNSPDRITVSFKYDPRLVAKVNTVDDRKWHPEEKYWSFPDSDDILKKILKIFEGEGNSFRPSPARDCPRFTDGAKQSRRIGTVPEV